MQLNGSPNLTVTLTPGVDQTETGTHFIAVRKAISVYADEFDHNGVCSGSPDEHLQLMVYVTVNATDVTVHIVQYIVATFIDDTIRAFIGSSPLCTSTTVPNNFSIGDCGDDGGGDQNLGYDGTATVVISC